MMSRMPLVPWLRSLTTSHPRVWSQTAALTALLGCLAATSPADAQIRPTRRHQPLTSQAAPGLAGRWAVAVNPRIATQPQAVRVELPDGEGSIAFYSADGAEAPVPPQSLALLQVGQLYRFRISDLPELPGAELYPTIELIDRLHPPCGRELEFPVPVAFTQEELQAALAGRLVTKVVYIERPQQATPERGTNAERAFLAGPAANPFELAHRAGRPVAGDRRAGRLPDRQNPDPGFYGDAAPVEIVPEVIGPRPAFESSEVLP